MQPSWFGEPEPFALSSAMTTADAGIGEQSGLKLVGAIANEKGHLAVAFSFGERTRLLGQRLVGWQVEDEPEVEHVIEGRPGVASIDLTVREWAAW